MKRRTIVGLAVAPVAAAAALVPIAGAGASGPTAHAAATKLRISAAPNAGLRFSKTRLTARRGKVTIVMVNPTSAGLPHGVAIAGRHVDKTGKVVDPGGKSVVTVKLRRGRYTFYCPFDGHRAAGMKGTLVVR